MSKDYKVAVWSSPGLFSDDIYRRLERGGDCGSGCGPGWLPIIEQLNRDLQEIDPDYHISQIKEKFGTLRFYAGMQREFENEQAAKEMSDKFWALIDEAEAKSEVTCEVCGRPAKSDNSTGWIKTLCWWHTRTRIWRRWWDNLKWDLKRGIQDALGLDWKWQRKSYKQRFKKDR